MLIKCDSFCRFWQNIAYNRNIAYSLGFVFASFKHLSHETHLKIASKAENLFANWFIMFYTFKQLVTKCWNRSAAIESPIEPFEP